MYSFYLGWIKDGLSFAKFPSLSTFSSLQKLSLLHLCCWEIIVKCFLEDRCKNFIMHTSHIILDIPEMINLFCVLSSTCKKIDWGKNQQWQKINHQIQLLVTMLMIESEKISQDNAKLLHWWWLVENAGRIHWASQ